MSKTYDSYQSGRQHSFARRQNSQSTTVVTTEVKRPPSPLKPEVYKASDPISLEIRGVSKDYKQGRSTVEILKNVNLTVKSGKILGIVGASGSGKSTLLHIAGLLDSQFSGSILIDGQNTKTLSSRERDYIRLKRMGFIYQYHHLLGDFTARENVAMPQIIAGRPKALALEEADALLARLGLGRRILNYPGELSGGEQQRVAVARSLINKPSLILADEPTGNLDYESAEMVMELFLELARARSLSAIIVTHNERIASKMDEVFCLRAGTLVAV